MVKAAEQYKNEDEKNRKRVEAKNGLENYTYSLRNTLREEKVASLLSADDKSTIEKAVDTTIQWLEANQLAEVEEFEHKQKELENVANPILTKMYQQAGGAGGAPGGAGGFPGGGFPGGAGGFPGGGFPGGAPGGGAAPGGAGRGPTVEEVD